MGILNYFYWSYEKRVSKHFVIFLNLPCLIACLLCCLLMCFVACFVVGDSCRSGFRQNYYLTPLPPSQFYFVPTHNSLFNTSDRYLKPVRALSWFRCSLAVYFKIMVTLRNVSRRASCKALRWDKVNCDSQSLYRPISYYILVAFG